MFTGLIEDVGTLQNRRTSVNSASLTIKTWLPLGEMGTGDSIAVNGVCLTAEVIEHAADGGILGFHTLPETLQKTNLGTLPVGASLNLERALKTGDRLGGHIVTGHIDTTCLIRQVRQRQTDYLISIDLPEKMQPLLIPQGSIAVDGISLTLAEMTETEFSVAIIPHTWQMTNLAEAYAGKPVNIETDIIGKYAQKNSTADRKKSGVSFKDLEDAGFY